MSLCKHDLYVIIMKASFTLWDYILVTLFACRAKWQIKMWETRVAIFTCVTFKYMFIV